MKTLRDSLFRFHLDLIRRIDVCESYAIQLKKEGNKKGADFHIAASKTITDIASMFKDLFLKGENINVEEFSTSPECEHGYAKCIYCKDAEISEKTAYEKKVYQLKSHLISYWEEDSCGCNLDMNMPCEGTCQHGQIRKLINEAIK